MTAEQTHCLIGGDSVIGKGECLQFVHSVVLVWLQESHTLVRKVTLFHTGIEAQAVLFIILDMLILSYSYLNKQHVRQQYEFTYPSPLYIDYQLNIALRPW
jgi:hypothetical protein